MYAHLIHPTRFHEVLLPVKPHLYNLIVSPDYDAFTIAPVQLSTVAKKSVFWIPN